MISMQKLRFPSLPWGKVSYHRPPGASRVQPWVNLVGCPANTLLLTDSSNFSNTICTICLFPYPDTNHCHGFARVVISLFLSRNISELKNYNLGLNKMEQETPHPPKSRMKPCESQNAPFSQPWFGGMGDQAGFFFQSGAHQPGAFMVIIFYFDEVKEFS